MGVSVFFASKMESNYRLLRWIRAMRGERTPVSSCSNYAKLSGLGARCNLHFSILVGLGRNKIKASRLTKKETRTVNCRVVQRLNRFICYAEQMLMWCLKAHRDAVVLF